MSDLRIALVAEGPTDAIIIASALKAILPGSFVLIPLQPEPTRPDLGSGWGGVLKWCREVSARGAGSLEDDPTLEFFDLMILHIDADVADKSYANYGQELERTAQQEGWGLLPCSLPCPPPDATVNNLRALLLSWLGMDAIGGKTVFCIPSKSSEAWLAAAVFPGNHVLLQDIECATTMADRLANLPKAQRIKKSQRAYQSHAATVKSGWDGVRQICSQANTFHLEVDVIAVKTTISPSSP